MSTCLVTGGAGFLGSHLCDELLRRGNRVICVDNFETGSLENIEHIRTDDFVYRQIDIIEPYFIDEPVDFVFHFASPASPIDYLRLPLHTLKVGSYGTHHTLGLAKAHRARFLTASTSDGSQTRPFCYVDDLIRGIIALSESGHHDPVNIGNPNEFTLLELAEQVIEITGSESKIVY